MTLDVHMHVGDFPMFGTSLRPAELPTLLTAYEISDALVSGTDNALVREAAERIRSVWGLYWASPSQAGCLDEAASYLDHPRFIGIRLHPALDGFSLSDPAVHLLIELLIERDLPAVVHGGHSLLLDPASIEKLIIRYPRAKIILSRIGHDSAALNAAVDIAVRHPRVYLDTSGMALPSSIASVEQAAPGHVLYGSESPFRDPGAEQGKVRSSGLDSEQTQAVLHGNAARLFFGG